MYRVSNINLNTLKFGKFLIKFFEFCNEIWCDDQEKGVFEYHVKNSDLFLKLLIFSQWQMKEGKKPLRPLLSKNKGQMALIIIIIFMTLGYFTEFVGINALSISVLFYEHPNKAFINHELVKPTLSSGFILNIVVAEAL